MKQKIGDHTPLKLLGDQGLHIVRYLLKTDTDNERSGTLYFREFGYSTPHFSRFFASTGPLYMDIYTILRDDFYSIDFYDGSSTNIE